VDFSRLNMRRTVVGGVAAALLLASLLLLPWFDLTDTPERADSGAWVCGEQEFSCTGWETFPIMRWLLLLAAVAPPILAYIVVRSHKLSWAPGELTMVAGFTAFVLIAYNGIIDPPGSGNQEIGITKEIGYYVALFSALGIAAAGTGRAMETTKDAPRKAPGTV